jgi:hypothetical protein
MQFIQKNPSKSETICDISYQAYFYIEDLLALCPTPQLEDHPLSAVVLGGSLVTIVWHVLRLWMK